MENKNIEVARKGIIFYVNANFTVSEVINILIHEALTLYSRDGVNIQLV